MLEIMENAFDGFEKRKENEVGVRNAVFELIKVKKVFKIDFSKKIS
jgi:hypothetical protein